MAWRGKMDWRLRRICNPDDRHRRGQLARLAGTHLKNACDQAASSAVWLKESRFISCSARRWRLGWGVRRSLGRELGTDRGVRAGAIVGNESLAQLPSEAFAEHAQPQGIDAANGEADDDDTHLPVGIDRRSRAIRLL